MANIRGFQNVNQRQGNQPQMNVNMPFLQTVSGNPHDENFATMLISTLCPKLRLFSVSIFLVVVITVLYFSMLGVGGIKPGGAFLEVTTETLESFGANTQRKVLNGQVFLWFSSVFLAYDFLNWIITCFFLLMFTSTIENTIGMRDTIIIFVFGGASGALFGDACNSCCNNVYAELNTGFYAFVGAYVGIMILNWQKLEAMGPMRMFLGCMIFMMILFMLMYAFSYPNPPQDNLGGLGGFLSGMFLSMALIEVKDSGSYEKNVRLFGLGFFGLQVGLCIILFFSLDSN